MLPQIFSLHHIMNSFGVAGAVDLECLLSWRAEPTIDDFKNGIADFEETFGPAGGGLGPVESSWHAQLHGVHEDVETRCELEGSLPMSRRSSAATWPMATT
jgi:hypothetical protein